jgi:uncharacterized protein YggE
MNEAKLWFWVLLDVLLAGLILAIMGIALPVAVQWSSTLTPSKTITVTAEGKTTAIPDIAEVSFSVVSQGADVQTITTANTSKMNAVLQFIATQNIASSDVSTTGYDLEPNYTYTNTPNTTGSQTISGYTLTQTVTVKIRNLANVSTVLSGLAPLGVNQIGGVNFTFDDPNTYLAVARADAFSQARTKALQMAADAGTSLGEVVSVSENGVTPGPLPVYAMSASAGSSEAVAPVTPNIQPGSQDITDDVTITYALR